MLKSILTYGQKRLITALNVNVDVCVLVVVVCHPCCELNVHSCCRWLRRATPSARSPRPSRGWSRDTPAARPSSGWRTRGTPWLSRRWRRRAATPILTTTTTTLRLPTHKQPCPFISSHAQRRLHWKVWVDRDGEIRCALFIPRWEFKTTVSNYKYIFILFLQKERNEAAFGHRKPSSQMQRPISSVCVCESEFLSRV